MTIPLGAVNRARDGSASALEDLIRDVWPHAFRIANGIVCDAALAEDAAQEACANLYRGIAKLRDAQAFPAWFYRIVVREALAIKRGRRPHQDLEGTATRDAADASVVRLDLERALERLSPVRRAIVVLHCYAGLNSREIGAVLQMPGGSIRFHLMRARRELERGLRDDRSVPEMSVGVAVRAI